MTMFTIGAAKVDITAWERGMCMLGWGHPDNKIEGVAMPLHARAVVIEDEDGNKVAYLCAELCFISLMLRRRVMSLLAREPQLGLGEHNTVLAATHNHSGPNGYSGDLYFDITAPGFSDLIFRTLADRFVEALREADRKRVPGRIVYREGEIPASDAVLFNRATNAYNRNPDVIPVERDRSDEAVDRTMRAVAFEDEAGRPLAAIHWVAVHGTTIHSDNRELHPDLHGLASRDVERWARDRHGVECVCIFAQGPSGDVTPNFRFDRARGVRVGRYDDDMKSAEHCGDVLGRAARRLLGGPGEELFGSIACATRYERFAERRVDRRFTDGVRDRVTTPARLGLSMALGTDEGHGPLYSFEWLTSELRDQRVRAGHVEDPKVPFVDLSAGEAGRLCGLLPTSSPLLASLPAPGMSHYRKLLRAGALGRDWAPSVIPVQVVRIGSLVIAALPCEPTTVAGRRLRAQLLARPGARHVVINGYANAYAQYVTTPEEYQEQRYEGGCTLFGPWTLGAFQSVVASVCDLLDEGRGRDDLGEPPAPPNLTQLGIGRYVGAV